MEAEDGTRSNAVSSLTNGRIQLYSGPRYCG